MLTPDPAPVIDLIIGFRQSRTLFAAVEFGVFDLLHGSPQTAPSLAKAVGARPEPLKRLLDACCSLGLLTLQEELYSNTELAAAYLRRASPRTLTGYILYSNRVLYRLWSNLEDAIREGSPRWTQTFGAEGSIFDHFFASDEAKAAFLAGMHGFGLLSSPSVVRLFNLNRFRHLVDLGGGTGHLVIAACERYGNLRGTLFDLPAAAGYAKPYVEASPARERIAIQAGDFFTDALPPADLYAVGRILHDWNEEKVQALLQKIHTALPPGGGLLIVEAVLDDGGCGPPWALMQSLNMLVCTEGRERTGDEYRGLLERAGFTAVDVRRTGGAHDCILALKPAT